VREQMDTPTNACFRYSRWPPRPAPTHA
jgi:hypothetical protein